MNDTVQHQKDSYEIRSGLEMQMALVEWFIIGQADYCMSPTIEPSTFSKTSICRGNCKFIAVSKRGEDCTKNLTSLLLTGNRKSRLVEVDQNIFQLVANSISERPIIFDQIPVSDAEAVELWSSVKITNIKIKDQCVPHHRASFISDYWSTVIK